MSERGAVELSVILLIGPQRERAALALDSLIEQTGVERMEILLFDYAAQEFPPLPGSDHPRVRVHVRDSMEPLGRSRKTAVGLAAGRIVAFIDDHCLAHPGWAEALMAAHRQGWDGVGPEVHNANPGVGISDAVHLLSYARWMPPAEPGEGELIVGHNSSYVREKLLAYGEQLATLLRCDAILQWRMLRDGARLAIDPAVKISHQNETDVPTLIQGAFLWNRMFAPTRAEVFEWSSLRRAGWLVLGPLVPFVRSAKFLWWSLRTKRARLPECVRALPIAFLMHSAAAIGEMVGLAAGVGEADEAFLRFELSRPRLGMSADEGAGRA